MNLTQKRIITYLQDHNYASAAELAGEFGMTVANIRHHLKILMENETIEIVEVRKLPGKGRSTYFYHRMPETLEHNLDGLIQALLDTGLENLTEPQKVDYLKRLAAWLGPTRMTLSGSQGSQLTQVIQILNQMHYKARWEAHSDAPHIYFNQCPYWLILPKHPELCQVDKFLLENLTGLSASQKAKIGPSRSCQFLITSRLKA